MTHRSSTLVHLVLIALVIAGCGPDRATAPAASGLSLALGAPSPLTAVAATSAPQAIYLSWTDRAPNETGYEVQRSTSGGAFDGIHTTLAGIISYSDGSVAHNTRYCYRVRAVRDRGSRPTYSEFSNTSCPTTSGPPPAPTGVDAQLTGLGTITAVWTASPGAQGYHVERSTSPEGGFTRLNSVTTTSYIEQGRPEEERACYRAVAYNSFGETPSTADCSTPPKRPSLLVATVTPASTVELRWQDNSMVEDGYEILRAGEDLVFARVAIVARDVAIYVDAGAPTDGRSSYQVRATKEQGFSDFSNRVTVLVASSPPSPPTNVVVLPASSSSVYITWTDASTNETGFRIERSTNGSAPWTEVGTIDWGAPTEFAEYGLTPDQEVCYRVFATNGRPDPLPSAIDCTAPPKAPTGLMATQGGTTGEIILAWSDEASVADGYEVQQFFCSWEYYYYDPQPYWICRPGTVRVVERGVKTWTATGLAPGESYDFQVIAFRKKGDRFGYSDPSATATQVAPP